MNLDWMIHGQRLRDSKEYRKDPENYIENAQNPFTNFVRGKGLGMSDEAAAVYGFLLSLDEKGKDMHRYFKKKGIKKLNAWLISKITPRYGNHIVRLLKDPEFRKGKYEGYVEYMKKRTQRIPEIKKQREGKN